MDDIFDKCQVHEKVCTTDCQMPFDNDNGTWDQCSHSQVCLVQVNETDNQPLRSWMICLLEFNLTLTTTTTTTLPTDNKTIKPPIGNAQFASFYDILTYSSLMETTSKMDLSFKFRKS